MVSASIGAVHRKRTPDSQGPSRQASRNLGTHSLSLQSRTGTSLTMQVKISDSTYVPTENLAELSQGERGKLILDLHHQLAGALEMALTVSTIPTAVVPESARMRHIDELSAIPFRPQWDAISRA